MTPPIVTSRSAVGTYQSCPRKRWHMYEAPNGTDTPGWESRKLAIPLVTGIYVHNGLAEAMQGASANEAASSARKAYLAEVSERGLMVEDGTDEQGVIDEQAAHVEALVLAWSRMRLPRWQEEYEVVSVEQEMRVALSDDVTLAARADAIMRRKADHRMFVLNFKTVSQADERWMRQWEVDMQLMTELLAAEHVHGQQFGGVIIEGLVKGPRVGVDQWLKEVRGEDSKDKVTSYIDRTRLLYGYKTDGDPPLVPKQYDWAGTTRKGWGKFRTWREDFTNRTGIPLAGNFVQPALEYWINWLPEEVLEQQFVTVPPILRDAQRIESCVRQIVSMERQVEQGTSEVTGNGAERVDHSLALDVWFPQNTHSCTYPGRCPMYDMCWVAGISDDPTSLFQPRIDHHKVKENV